MSSVSPYFLPKIHWACVDGTVWLSTFCTRKAIIVQGWRVHVLRVVEHLACKTGVANVSRDVPARQGEIDVDVVLGLGTRRRQEIQVALCLQC